jgi:hypothetical protein
MMSSGALSPASMKVLVMRGMGMCCVAFAAAAAGGALNAAAAGELVLQVALQDAIFDEHVALRGWPSSSTLSEPRRLEMVPSSITVQSSLATFCRCGR